MTDTNKLIETPVESFMGESRILVRVTGLGLGFKPNKVEYAIVDTSLRYPIDGMLSLVSDGLTVSVVYTCIAVQDGEWGYRIQGANNNEELKFVIPTPEERKSRVVPWLIGRVVGSAVRFQ